MTRPVRITLAVLGTIVIVTAAAGGSWIIAALDGPLWAIALVVAVGVGSLVGLGCGLTAPAREPSWREREGRRDGYVTDGDGCHAAARSCLDDRDAADGLERLIVDGRIDPYGDRDRWAS